MEEIAKQLLSNRPNLSASSIKTYSSLLKSLHLRLFPDDELNVDNFYGVEQIMEHLSQYDFSKRKTTLAALYALTGLKEYHNYMMKDLDKHNENELQQTQNEKQAANMIEFDEVKKVLTKYENNTKLLYKKQGELDTKDLQQIQLYILLVLTTGAYFEPRRSQDWNMKWRDYDPETDNYYNPKTNTFTFNTYKTSNVYGEKSVKAPKKVRYIMQAWIKRNPSEYVLFNTKGKPLTPPEIAHRLNEIFNKQISTSMLRHIYLTSYYKEAKPLKEMAATASNMGHSVVQALQYVKNPKEENK